MSVLAPIRPTYQPFECLTCHTRFTRHENLKRHAAAHTRSSQEPSFLCAICGTGFSRRDLRHRHVKKKHPGQDQQKPSKRARPSSSLHHDGRQNLGTPNQVSFLGVADTAQVVRYGPTGDISHDKRLSNESQPDRDQTGIEAVERHVLATLSSGTSRFWQETESAMSASASPYSSASPTGSNTHSPGYPIPDGLSLQDVPFIETEWFPSAAQALQGYDLYFTHVSPFVPFIHRPTFDATEVAPCLGLGMLCIAYQYGEDPDCDDAAGSGEVLSLRCFHRARVLTASLEQQVSEDSTTSVMLVQAYWLLEMCAMMYLCGQYSRHGLRFHSRMVALARSSGLTQSMATNKLRPKDLESLWLDFVRAESHKRTMLAVHHLDSLLYQFLSIPRSLSHLEIKHDMPCSEQDWTTSSAAQWAHSQLVSRHAGATSSYADAIRYFSSEHAGDETLPPFDPVGAINITQFFLISSREVSGWSTMTGRVSLDRIDALKASLLALEPFVRPSQPSADAVNTLSSEATWEMAMVELRKWSPSHTFGFVESSMDAMLTRVTSLAASGEAICLSSAQAVQPHIDWFLRYLDQSAGATTVEPPLVLVYAYKAFLIAWQLVKLVVQGAMQVVGIADGDTLGAIKWAQQVFGRRGNQKLYTMINSCIDTLPA